MSQDIKVNILPEALKAAYSDVAFIQVTPFGITIDFGQQLPQAKRIEVVTRVAMSPQHAKMLSKVLDDNVKKYEQQFGEIKVTESMKKSPKVGFDE